MRLPSGLRALRHRDYRRFYVGQLVSLVGNWMQSVAQAWLVLDLTHSAFKLGLIGTLQFTPVLVFSVFAGALADRVPKRRMLITTQIALAVQAVTLAALVVSGRVEYWHVCVLGFLLGCINTIDLPARQSFIMDMVGKADVVSAVALNSAAFNGARIIGPAVAGILIARFGVAPAFSINALSFVVVIAALATVRTQGLPVARGDTTLLQEIGEALRYALRTPRIRVILTILLVVSLCVFNFTVYVPLFARRVLAQGAEGFGFLMAAVGVGAVTGALALGFLPRRPPPLALIFAAGATACLGLVTMAAVSSFVLALPVLFVIGIASIMAAAGCNSTLQLSAPDAMRGRVMSLYTLVFGGVFPIGSFLVGTIAELRGVPTAFVSGGATGLAGLAAIAAWWRLRGGRRRVDVSGFPS
jgi:predicted MFS family arabinose efflux permease